ncbi:MAG: DEAD/DEAH box helicase family protein [Methanomassiliicoccaceae archaeon]|jgi:Fanconi anemia group M protein|nr:DEAD/DEAH box helicase family protein [Methanomassiliicoccaceae archaeon]
MASFVKHPRIIPDTVEEREYQLRMAEGCSKDPTLLILPTGLGKTIVALYVTANILEKGKKVLVLAPTKPLVDQHNTTFSSLLVNTKVGVMNGNMPPEKRKGMLENNDVTVATPQAVANDLENKLYDLNDFGLVIYDEAHRGTGKYAYVAVAEEYAKAKGLSMGMTASPGSEREKIDEICCNLSLKKIDMRTDDDPDVSPYTYNVTINKIELDMPKDLTDIVTLLYKMFDDYARELINLRALAPMENVSTKQLLIAGRTLQFRHKMGERSATLFRAMSVQSMAIKIAHAIGLAETQGTTALRAYLEKLTDSASHKEGGKGAKEITSRKEYKEVLSILGTTKVEHPKISRVMSLVSKEVNYRPLSKVMVFSHYRNTCELLVEKLATIDGVSVGKLIGQSDGGLKQKEQTEMLRSFRDGKYNVIVATSVGEEGLDVASTDLVIFYENVPSEIRTIQRRGRTGRKNDGVIYVLTAKGTRDEAYEAVSSKKEEMMLKRLRKMRESIRKDPIPRHIQKGMADFDR